MRYGGLRIEDAFIVDRPYRDEERAAIDEAHRATALFVRDHLLRLAAGWERYRPFFHADKHGLLVVNPHDGGLFEDQATPVEGIVVWRRRKPDAEGAGTIEPPYSGTNGQIRNPKLTLQRQRPIDSCRRGFGVEFAARPTVGRGGMRRAPRGRVCNMVAAGVASVVAAGHAGRAYRFSRW